MASRPSAHSPRIVAGRRMYIVPADCFDVGPRYGRMHFVHQSPSYTQGRIRWGPRMPQTSRLNQVRNPQFRHPQCLHGCHHCCSRRLRCHHCCHSNLSLNGQDLVARRAGCPQRCNSLKVHQVWTRTKLSAGITWVHRFNYTDSSDFSYILSSPCGEFWDRWRGPSD